MQSHAIVAETKAPKRVDDACHLLLKARWELNLSSSGLVDVREQSRDKLRASVRQIVFTRLASSSGQIGQVLTGRGKQPEPPWHQGLPGRLMVSPSASFCDKASAPGRQRLRAARVSLRVGSELPRSTAE